MSQLIYPTLDLFLYDLKVGFGQSADEIDQSRHTFWQRIYGDPQKTLSGQSLDTKIAEIKNRENSEANFVELLGDQIVEQFETGKDGYYYPLQLRDTYALHVDYSGEFADSKNQLNTAAKSVDFLSQYKDEILSHINHQQGKLGHTWLLWGQLTATDNDADKIAKECHNKLFPNSNWQRDLQGKSEFFGVKVYELWQPPQNWSDLTQLETSEHLLIWLFPAHLSLDEIRDSIAELYLDFIHLFCYRHKALWAYSQSRKLKEALKQVPGALVTSTQSESPPSLTLSLASQSLKTLRTVLNQTEIDLSNYAIALGQLEAQERTIEINVNNYKKRLTRFDKEGQLTSLAEFGEFATAKYLQQVQMDRASLSYGLTVLENKIRTIDSIVKTYQTESDRNLNTTVATFGAALGTSQLVAAVMLDQYDTPPNKPFFLTMPFGVSLLAGVVAGAIAWAIFRRH